MLLFMLDIIPVRHIYGVRYLDILLNFINILWSDVGKTENAIQRRYNFVKLSKFRTE